MNEEPKSIWKSPLTGRRKWLAWVVLLAAVIFVVTFIVSLGTAFRLSESSVLASLIAIVGAPLGLLAARFIRWLCCWRNLRRFLLGVACFVTLIFLAYAVENWRGKHAWEAHKLHWEAKGEKLELTQLVPPPVPDEQNFAMTPLLKPALDYTRGPEGVVWRDTNGVARLEKLRPDLDPKHVINDHLALGNLEKGTFADLAACRKFYRGNTNYPQPATAGTAAEDILFALGRFDPEIKELRAEAVARPLARFPIEYEYQPTWAILLPHLARMKGLTLLTYVRVTAELEAGRLPDAFADLKLGLRLSDAIRDEPILIDYLVRIAMLNLNLQALREGLVRHAWTETQLAELQKYLASLNLLAEYKLAMRGERVCLTSGLEWLRQHGFRAYASVIEANGIQEQGFAKLVTLMPSGWYYQNMLTVSEFFQKFNLPMVDEKTHRVFPDVAAKSDEAVFNWVKRPKPYNLIARKLMPALGAAGKKSARWQTFVDAACVACALERSRLANGKLPETLAALAPRFIESIPTDVIDGKPLRYRLKPDGGYVLYSIGWNQTDDGGEIGWAKSSDGKSLRVDIEKGDWVWQMPAKPNTAAELALVH